VLLDKLPTIYAAGAMSKIMTAYLVSTC